MRLMKIYWTLKSIPEFEGMSRSAIRKIWLRSYWKTYYHWQQWLISSVIIIYSIFVASDYGRATTHIFLMGALGVIIFWLWFQISVAIARPYIKEQIDKS